MKNVDRPNNGCDKQEKAQNPHGTLPSVLERYSRRVA
jgi:hypothetical protein